MELRREQEKDHSIIPNSPTYQQVASTSAVSIPQETTRNGPSLLSPNKTLDQPHHGHRHGSHDSPDPDPPSQATTNVSNWVQYKECLKNHAASQGKHVVDGCGEFMPSGEEGTPEALICAACDCHRNFHRKERRNDNNQQQQQQQQQSIQNYNNRTSQGVVFRPQPLTMPPPQQHYSHGFTTTSPIMMNFGGRSGMAAESSSEDLNVQGVGNQLFSTSKKRVRTKFSQDQKVRMHEFGERLGWKIQKQDEQQVQQFCNDLGIKRQVFKVWMHNNKQAMKRNQM